MIAVAAVDKAGGAITGADDVVSLAREGSLDIRVTGREVAGDDRVADVDGAGIVIDAAGVVVRSVSANSVIGKRNRAGVDIDCAAAGKVGCLVTAEGAVPDV